MAHLEVLQRVLAEVRDEIIIAEMSSQKKLPHPRFLSQIKSSHKQRMILRPTKEVVDYNHIDDVSVDMTQDLESQYTRHALGAFARYKDQYGYSGQRHMRNTMYHLNLGQLQQAHTTRGLNKVKRGRGRGRGGRGRGQNNYRNNNYNNFRGRGGRGNNRGFNSRGRARKNFNSRGRGRGNMSGFSSREVAILKKNDLWLPLIA